MESKIVEFAEKIISVNKKQKNNYCQVAETNFYEKLTYDEAARILHKTEKENLINWADKRNKNNVFVLTNYCGIGTAFIAVDYDKKEWLNITDYRTW